MVILKLFSVCRKEPSPHTQVTLFGALFLLCAILAAVTMMSLNVISPVLEIPIKYE